MPPRLSLCLIARNEAGFLPACLVSVQGVANEVVVGDTGSTDETVRLAREAGARVVSVPWQEDFAAARNATLAATTGNWILWLDADERLGPGAGPALLQALDTDAFDGGFLPLFNASAEDAAPEDVISGRARDLEPVLLPRLFRRTPDLAWKGIVHEDVADWLGAPRRRIQVVPAPIVHYGDVPGVRTSRQKSARNLALLRLRLQREPDWIPGWEFLSGEILKTSGQEEAAMEALDEGWRRLQARHERGETLPPMVNLAQRRASLQARRGAFEDAITTLAQARAWGAVHPNLDHAEAWVRVTRASLLREPPADLLKPALALLRRCLLARDRWYAEEPIPGIFGVRSLVLAGTASLMLGRPREALALFDTALEERPGDPEARTGRVEALLDLGQARAALAEVEGLLQEDQVDPWFLAAAAAAAAGASADARWLAAEAWRRKPRGLHVPRRIWRVGGLL